ANRERLFKDVPIVAAYANPGVLRDAGGTGVFAGVSYRGGVEMAMAIDPRIKRVVFIDGVRNNQGNIEREARSQLAPLAGRVDVTYLRDRSIDDVVAAVRALPPDAVVFYIRQQIRAPGEDLDSATALAAISAASSVPVYGALDALVGR